MTPGGSSPDNLLAIRHAGAWTLAEGSMTGWLRIQEVLDGEVEVHDSGVMLDTGDSGDSGLPVTSTTPPPEEVEGVQCSVIYILTGVAPDDPTCASCDLVFDVTHTVTAGDPGRCQQLDVPATKEVRQLGWDPEGWVRWNVAGSGAWVAQYSAQLVGDEVRFAWDTVVGVQVDEEEETE